MCSSTSISLYSSREIFLVWVFKTSWWYFPKDASITERAAGLTDLIIDRVDFKLEGSAFSCFSLKFFRNNVPRESVRRLFPFAAFVLIELGKCWCKIKVLTETKEFNRSIAVYLLLTALFESSEQVKLVIAFQNL